LQLFLLFLFYFPKVSVTTRNQSQSLH